MIDREPVIDNHITVGNLARNPDNLPSRGRILDKYNDLLEPSPWVSEASETGSDSMSELDESEIHINLEDGETSPYLQIPN